MFISRNQRQFMIALQATIRKVGRTQYYYTIVY